MKNKKIILVFILVFGLQSFSEAQYCNSFAMSKGMVLHYQNFDSKGEVTLSSKTTCLDVSTLSSGAVIYKVNTSVTDAKDVSLSFWEYEMECKDGRFYVSMGSFTDPELMKEYEDLDIYIDTTGMEYPAMLSESLALPDAKFEISKAEIGVTMKTYDVVISDRKVVGIESVTVPAGTFDCFKITYEMDVKDVFKKKYNVTEYISEGTGKIKTETYNRKGKLMSSSVLIELIK